MLELTEKCIEWIKKYFETTNGKKAIIGISGGKDSTVCAALCKEAIGDENVIGVLMPDGTQEDIYDSYKVCNILGINKLECNIHPIYYEFDRMISETGIDLYEHKQAYTNLSPRIRTTLLYTIAQCTVGGRVCNTSNKCELFVGWGTFGADTFGDFSPLGNLVISEIKQIGYDLNLPKELIDKAPSDGLTGKTDEDNLGFTYADVEKAIKLNGDSDFYNSDTFKKIMDRYSKNKFKSCIINVPKFLI